MKDKRKSIFVILVGYVFITLLMTYPLVFHLTTHIPGEIPGGVGDGHQNLWNIWHFKKRLLSFQNPFYTNYLYYPIGVKLIFHTYGVFNNLLALPFKNIILGYNFVVLFSFVLSACGMYLLSFYLTQNKLASFVAGIIFAFCPYKFAHLLGHLNLVSTEWIPFYILYLIKTFKEPFSYKNICLTSIFFLLTIFCSYYYAFYLIIFTILFLAFEVRDKIFNKRTFLLIFVIFMLTLPILTMGFQAYLEGDLPKVSGHKQESADLLAFFIPSPLHPLFGPYIEPIYWEFRASIVTEAPVFIGYTVLALVIYSIFSQRKKLKFWLISALCFFIFSLGPVLRIYGHDIFPLPSQLLYHLPVINSFKFPSRFSIMFVLCLGIIAAYGIKSILLRLPSTKNRFILPSIFSALILFEYAAFPYPMDPWPSSKLAHHIKSAFKSLPKGSVLFIPFGDWGRYRTATLMYFQTIFNRPMLGGYISRTPCWTGYYENAPILGTIKKLARGEQVNKERMIKDRKLIEEMIRLYNIQYIVGIKQFLNDSLFEYCTKIFNQRVLSCKELDNILIICSLRPTPPLGSFKIDFTDYSSQLYTIKGFTEGTISGKHVKLARGKSSLVILPPLKEGNYKLKLKIKSFTDKGKVAIFLNKEKVIQQKLTKKILVFEFRLPENLVKKHKFLKLKFKDVPLLRKLVSKNIIQCPDKKALPLAFISLDFTSKLPSLPPP